MTDMNTKCLASVVLMFCVSAGSAEAASCSQEQRIKDAFTPNIAYQASRAERAMGSAAAQNVYNDFNAIGSGDMGCRDLYNLYNSYLGDVTTNNDRALQGGGSGLGFKKW